MTRKSNVRPKDKIALQLEELLASFLSAAGSLFRHNQKYLKEFEGGRYSCAYLTLSRRLRHTMAVDREVLLVASTFPDQQQRTVKFVQNEIASTKGRLEPTLALVVHLDPSGNGKLRNWGRDLSISILPVDGRSGFGEEREIERKLAQQLFSHDPFDVTGPVSGDSNFFGRRDEAIDLARKLQLGQIRACLGIRKVGKTSIINRVLKEIPEQFDCAVVMIDCSKDDVFELEAKDLLYSISCTLRELGRKGEDYLSVLARRFHEDLPKARIDLEEAVFATERKVLFVFDEVDYITPGSPTAKHWREEFNRFWRNLRVIYQECERQNKSFSLLLGGVSTHWFTVEEIEGVENAALSFIPEEFLSPMPKGATVAMLRRLGKVAGINFTEEAADWIAEETGNIPYWARKCSSFVHRQVAISERPKTLEKSDVVPLVEQFVQNEGCQIAEVALAHLFRVHPNMRRASEIIFNDSPEKVPEATRRTLRKYGVINSGDDFSGSMFRTAIESIFESNFEDTDGAVEVTDPAEGFLADWAEELAALGQRRNLIERKLRSVALNFLRLNALQNKKLEQLTTAILNSISTSRRKMLTGHKLDALFSKLMWLELVEIISSNWTIFEAIFGDRKEFEANAKIVNDRPDAHAKEWDQADFALYRRSLFWFEERVAKLQ